MDVFTYRRNLRSTVAWFAISSWAGISCRFPHQTDTAAVAQKICRSMYGGVCIEKYIFLLRWMLLFLAHPTPHARCAPDRPFLCDCGMTWRDVKRHGTAWHLFRASSTRRYRCCCPCGTTWRPSAAARRSKTWCTSPSLTRPFASLTRYVCTYAKHDTVPLPVHRVGDPDTRGLAFAFFSPWIGCWHSFSKVHATAALLLLLSEEFSMAEQMFFSIY